jgi:uncharacterized membrane protein YfcA
MYSLILFFISIFAGFLGSLLGLGGGIIIVPALTLLFKVDIRYAVAASLISIIATSSTGAGNFIKEKLTNIRVAVLLELGTVAGALTGYFISSEINAKWLYLLFGFFLIFSALMMIRRRGDQLLSHPHPWSLKLGLSGTYSDGKKEPTPYHVAHVPLGLFSMYFAGILSALLGIGSGIFKVMAMDSAMKLPIKVSTATSNFMIGVTAAASAGAYFLRGDMRPEITSPVALGIFLGSWVGGRMMTKIQTSVLRRLFVVILLVVSFQMILKGLRL